MLPRTPACLMLLMLLIWPAFAQATHDADRASLVQGVTEIVAPGAIPGPLAVVGPDAFVVMTARTSRQRLPMIAAARHGQGRVVAVGHGSLVGGDNLDHPDNQRLLLNALAWAGDGPVALHGHDDALAVIRDAGREARVIDDAALDAGLDGVGVLFTSGFTLDRAPQARIDAVRAFITAGGGVVIDGLGWGWQQLNPNRNLIHDFGGNRLLAPLGITFADGYFDRTGEQGYLADDTGLALSHASAALEALAAHEAGDQVLEEADLAQVGATLASAVRAIPETDTLLLPRLRTLTAQAGPAVPTAEAPISVAQPLARLAVIAADAAWRQLPPEQVTADPSATAFPGPVPADAPRVRRTLSVDTGTPAWHSLGLYAPPGEAITISVTDRAAGQGLAVRIGCHTDQLWHLDRWQRFPDISLRRPLAEAVTTVASPFGGLIYVDVPGSGPGSQLGTVEVTVSGAVEAPLFRLGETTPEQWQTVRNHPAPWGELATDKVILSVPSEVLRQVDDPTEVCALWDQVMDACADLAAIPRERERPERYVPDQQISAGYMHSGYPIMTWMDVTARMADAEALRTNGGGGYWGFFHEMGHNHQSPHWTFGGTGEVTCNLFSLYVMEQVCGIPTGGHEAVSEDTRQRKLAEHLAAGAPFDKWQADPFLALTMYVQLQQAFGWEPFKAVFADYRQAPADELPTTDDAKRDQWLVRFSRQVGRNLGPFFETWGVPTSAAARAGLDDLPVWLPEELAAAE